MIVWLPLPTSGFSEVHLIFWPTPLTGPSNVYLMLGSSSAQGENSLKRLKSPTMAKTLSGGAAISVDLVTTSPSGLDPDISPEGALFQVPRVAKARNMPEDRVRQLVTENTRGRFAGLLGEPRVNVLALNLALDAASK